MPIVRDPKRAYMSGKTKEQGSYQPAKEYATVINEVYYYMVRERKKIGASVENNTFCVSVHYQNVVEEQLQQGSIARRHFRASKMGKRFLHQLLAVVLALFVSPARSGDWLPATATFYGGANGSDTMGGACGYSDLYEQGYGINNAALSTALFNDGASCGQCYVIICDSSKTGWCKPGNNWVVVSATNFCPPNWDLSASGELPAGGWCAPPRPHFDMSQPAWENIGISTAGIIPVLYQRVKCWKNGGVRFTIAGFDHFYMVLITNVAGSGSIQSMAVKGANTDWIPMYRNWGANWHCLSGGLVGQGLSFALISTGGQNIIFQDVVPAWWQFGQTYTTYQNFDY